MNHLFKVIKIGFGILLSLTVFVIFFTIMFGIFFEDKTDFTLQKEAAETIDQPAEDLYQDSSVSVSEPTESDFSSETETYEPPKSVTLAFAGDVQFPEEYTSAYDDSGIAALVDDTMLSHMRNADLLMLNHEFSFSLRGEPMEDKQFTFCTDPKYVQILQDLGTDVVSLANNHSMDYGEDAFLDTLETLRQADIDYVGAGKDLSEALSPAVYTINGQTFAIFAGTRVIPTTDWYAKEDRPGMVATYDPTGFNQAIAEAEPQYDHIVVFVHWGIERNEFPEDYQRILAQGYIDAGADLVVGCHPHVLQGFEYYKNVPIIYSLGNYLFGINKGQTLLLLTEFDPEGELCVRLVPCQRINGVLAPIKEPAALFSYLESLSFQADISEDGVLSPK